MKFSRVRFTVRRMMLVVVAVALILAAGLWAFDRYWSIGKVITYPVADLIPLSRTGSLPTGLTEFAGVLKSSVTPDVWWSSRRSVTPFSLSLSLIVRHTEEGHNKVAAWLEAERSRRSGIAKPPASNAAAGNSSGPPGATTPTAKVPSIGLDPDAPILAYFRKHGIELEKDKDMSNWWTVSQPSAGDFRLVVAFHSFPPSSTEQQMRDELLPISLAFILNAPAHLAMSYPSQRGMRPDAALRSPDDEVTEKRMIELFNSYKSPDYRESEK